MQIKFGSVFGNYRWNATISNVSREALEALAPFGCLQIDQRSPSTAAEKEIAGYGDKRPQGFKRTDIPFTPEGVETLKKHLSTLVIPNGENEITLPVEVEVTEYEGSTKESKYTDERKKYVQRCSEGKGSTLAKAVGYDGPIGDGTAEGAPMAFLQAIRAWVKAQAAAL